MFFLRAKHPQHQHIDQDMPNAAVEKGICQKLPNHSVMDYQSGYQAGIKLKITFAEWRDGAKQDLQKKDNDAGDDDALHPKGERGKA